MLAEQVELPAVEQEQGAIQGVGQLQDAAGVQDALLVAAWADPLVEVAAPVQVEFPDGPAAAVLDAAAVAAGVAEEPAVSQDVSRDEPVVVTLASFPDVAVAEPADSPESV